MQKEQSQNNNTNNLSDNMFYGITPEMIEKMGKFSKKISKATVDALNSNSKPPKLNEYNRNR